MISSQFYLLCILSPKHEFEFLFNYWTLQQRSEQSKWWITIFYPMTAKIIIGSSTNRIKLQLQNLINET